MNKIQKKFKEGFTLVEILVVVALIAILATLTIVAVNPQGNLQKTRDAKRSAQISEILNAINQYIAEENNSLGDFGTIPACSGTPANIGTAVGNIDLSNLVTIGAISEIPNDPQAAATDGTNTEYTICLQTTSNRVQIDAPNAEGGDPISVR